MNRRKILITGAAGYIASLILPDLRSLFDLVLLDAKNTDFAGNKTEDIHMVDLVSPDRDQYRTFFRDVDTVVHLAYVGPGEKDNSFWTELSNIQMAYNIYQTALEEQVSRVIVSSSNHAANFYESLILEDRWDVVTPETMPLAYDYYGWSKESIEQLGFTFAVGKLNNRPLEVIQLRIGAPREDDLDQARLGDMKTVRRALAAYISPRDLSQLFTKSILAENVINSHGIPFQIFYGISNNMHAYWSITNARQVIGYQPVDVSEIKFAEQFTKHLLAAHETQQK